MVSLTTHARETGGSCRPGRPARWAPSPARPNAALRAADVTRGAHSARRAGRSGAPPARSPQRCSLAAVAQRPEVMEHGAHGDAGAALGPQRQVALGEGGARDVE